MRSQYFKVAIVGVLCMMSSSVDAAKGRTGAIEEDLTSLVRARLTSCKRVSPNTANPLFGNLHGISARSVILSQNVPPMIEMVDLRLSRRPLGLGGLNPIMDATITSIQDYLPSVNPALSTLQRHSPST